MTYPEDFVQEVRNAYPHEEELHSYLDNGYSMLVGRFLQEEAKWKLSAQQVVDLINNGQENAVRLEAMRIVVAEKLYKKWGSLLGHYSHASS